MSSKIAFSLSRPTTPCLISQLRAYANNDVHILGIVVHLTDVNTFSAPNKKRQTDNLVVTDDNRLVLDAEPEMVDKSVFGFVIADQPMSTIEFKFWGEPELAIQLREVVKIGNLIKITRPKVVAKNINNTSAQFSPLTFSSNQLLFVSGTSIMLGPSNLRDQYFPLLSIAPSFDYFTLYDITMCESEMHLCEVNMLAVVAQIKEPVTTFSEKLKKEIVR